MKAITNVNATSLAEAVERARTALAAGQVIAFSGGGSDLLQQVKDGTRNPDVVINLGAVTGADQLVAADTGIQVGALMRLSRLATDSRLDSRYAVLKEAAAAVGSPQIRNVGTVGGNISQRPWCWYYRNGFPCYKAGGDQCFSVTGENQLHAIFGGGPSFIVHPSDLAPALVALDARIQVQGSDGERSVPAGEFFTLPALDPARENILQAEELVAGVLIPPLPAATRSTYFKVMDRETWTHAVVSAAMVLELDEQQVRRASIVLGGVAPIPWRLPAVESLLQGKRLTAELARDAGQLAIREAQPLGKNAYKLPLTAATVEQTLMTMVN